MVDGCAMSIDAVGCVKWMVDARTMSVDGNLMQLDL